MPDQLKIPPQLVIDNLDTLKVLSDPTRLEILKHIGDVNKRGKRCTVKQLAKLMQTPPTKLYYHIKLLEEHELLVVGETRVVSGIIEKHYQVAAMDISLDQNALSLHTGAKNIALEEVLNSINQIVTSSLNNIRASLITRYEEELAAKEGGAPAGKQFAMQISKDEYLLTFDQAESFKERLTNLLQELEKLSDQNLSSAEPEALYIEVTSMVAPQYQRRVNNEVD